MEEIIACGELGFKGDEAMWQTTAGAGLKYCEKIQVVNRMLSTGESVNTVRIFLGEGEYLELPFELVWIRYREDKKGGAA